MKGYSLLLACFTLGCGATQRVAGPIDLHTHGCGAGDLSCARWLRSPTGKLLPGELETLKARLGDCYAQLSPDDLDEHHVYPPPKLQACMDAFGWHYQVATTIVD